jgi:transcriptional regulator with XRE-family HTH domain
VFNIFNLSGDGGLRLQELGYVIRKARLSLGRTQADLARAAGVSRTTMNQLENGLFPDIGVRKAQAILDQLDLELHVRPAHRRRADHVLMARTAANGSFRGKLSEPELVRVLLTGRIAARHRPHVRALLAEAPLAVLKGLVHEVGRWAQPGRVVENVRRVSEALGTERRTRTWLKDT